MGQHFVSVSRDSASAHEWHTNPCRRFLALAMTPFRELHCVRISRSHGLIRLTLACSLHLLQIWKTAQGNESVRAKVDLTEAVSLVWNEGARVRIDSVVTRLTFLPTVMMCALPWPRDTASTRSRERLGSSHSDCLSTPSHGALTLWGLVLRTEGAV